MPYSALIGMAATALLSAGDPATCQRTDQTPVNVRPGGDDQLTLMLVRAVQEAFGNCDGFALTQDDASGYLVVTIKTNVGRRPLGNRIRTYFQAEYVTRRREHRRLAGSCWEDQLSVCAAQVVRHAPSINMA